jgi:alpha-tubulin suppressor-like RCC1 family protein
MFDPQGAAVSDIAPDGGPDGALDSTLDGGGCGNGRIEAPEACDGPNLGGTQCTDLGYFGGTLACTAQCAFDTSGCTMLENCGNGVLDADEECDDGADGDPCDGCLDNCRQHENTCGDGYLCGQEQCDAPPNGDPCDGCTDNCTIYTSTCGDNIVCAPETCDDGANGDPCDGCLDNCAVHQNICGDGYLCGQEQCDGAAMSETECSALGYVGGALACNVDCTFNQNDCYPRCGNNICESDQGTETIATCPDDCGWVAITAGGHHTCALRADQTAWCWGGNWDGQLGDGTGTTSHVPVPVDGLNNVVDLSIQAWSNTCAVTADGLAWCWGLNDRGQLGDGTNDPHDSPVQVISLSGVVSISNGTTHTCAVTDSEAIWCWGNNGEGALGNDSTSPSLFPVQVSTATGLTNAWRPAVGWWNHTCATTVTGTVWCWGSGWAGQLGNASNFASHVPVEAIGLSGVISISSGDHHTCAVTDSGTAWCWGSAGRGQIGDGQYINRNTPVEVANLSGVEAISNGYEHTCAMTTSGSGWCWGKNDNGQLGNMSHAQSPVPVQVQGLSDIVEIATGNAHSCAVLGDGTAWCWGDNSSGKLGDGSTTSSLSPVEVQDPAATP